MHRTEELTGLKDARSDSSHCVGCGKPTVFSCPFCLLRLSLSVPICEKPECREKHEANGCIRTRKA